MKAKLIIFYCMFVFISCKHDVNSNNSYKKHLIKINDVYYDSITFHLDSLSLPYSKMFQYYEDSIKEYFTYFNSHTNSIYLFDYKTKKQEAIFNCSTFSRDINSYFIHNKDSILLLDSKRNVLFLVDKSWTDCTSINLKHEMINDSVIFPYQYIEPSLPPVIYNNSIYIMGYHVGEFFEYNVPRKVIMKNNFKTTGSDFLINLPGIYNEFNWGTTYNYIISSTYNPIEHLIILNFPIYHDLYVYDLDTEKGRYVQAGSNFIKSIEPYSVNKKDILDSNERQKYYLENHSYESVFYDKYKNIYYRIAAFPISNSEVKRNDAWKKRQYNLIILSSDFKYLGELAMKGVLPDNVFINKSGFHIQTFSDDNEINFRIINIKN